MVREAIKFFAWQRLRFIANASLWEMREVKEMDGRFWEVTSGHWPDWNCDQSN